MINDKLILLFSLQEVNPWEVKGDADGRIDYEKLQKKVSCGLGLDMLSDFTAKKLVNFCQVLTIMCSLAAHVSPKS